MKKKEWKDYSLKEKQNLVKQMNTEARAKCGFSPCVLTDDHSGIYVTTPHGKTYPEYKESIMEENLDLKQQFYGWGNYKKGENCVYLYNNDSLTDKNFIELVKKHKVKIQLDLFT